jgi:hypothetical protein
MIQILENLEGVGLSRLGACNWAQLGRAAVLVVLTTCLYHGILRALVQQWWNDPIYSHGFFVPVFSGFVLWRERRYLITLTLNPSWQGLLVVMGALGLLVLGVLEVELSLSRSSLLWLLVGLMIYFLGRQPFESCCLGYVSQHKPPSGRGQDARQAYSQSGRKAPVFCLCESEVGRPGKVFAASGSAGTSQQPSRLFGV